jgi:beta-1,4-mannosyltransferase
LRVLVASVPGGHPYVRHLGTPGAGDDQCVRLLDPDPCDPRRPARGPWWPAAMLEPSWVRDHRFDLMHVHFGFDHRSPAQLAELVEALRDTGRPLVLTVHDLRSPHQEDAAVLAAQLDVLVPAATSLLTLTTSAADVVAERWGRRAEVVPHPHVVDLDVMAAVRAQRAAAPPVGRGAHVGVALKGLRTNTDGVRLVPGLARLTAQGHRVSVTLHREALERDAPRALAAVAALQDAHRRGEVELVVHDPLPDGALWRWVADLDVAVLPYRFGTHSGWLEMCHDLGTSVVAPSTGHYAAQGADATYTADEHDVDTSSLVPAVEQALGDRARALPGLPGLGATERLLQRRQVAALHERVYAAAIAGTGSARTTAGAA